MDDRFAGRVAIVTGGGAGLGRVYALQLARAGARVVVNDTGCAIDGTGRSPSAAAVAAEIVANGGEAIADEGDVSDPAAMTAMAEAVAARWGGIHILVNSAGIMRNRSFAKMVPADFARVVAVHLLGSAYATHACWPWFREQRYGRVVMSTSSSGVFGRWPQPDYAAAKMGLVGLARTLQIEGQRRNIRVNCLMPIAGTRATRDVLPDEVFAQFTPEKILPALFHLVGDDAPQGGVYAAAAGVFQKVHVALTAGVALDGDDMTPDGFAAHEAAIADRTGETVPETGRDHILSVYKALRRHR